MRSISVMAARPVAMIVPISVRLFADILRGAAVDLRAIMGVASQHAANPSIPTGSGPSTTPARAFLLFVRDVWSSFERNVTSRSKSAILGRQLR